MSATDNVVRRRRAHSSVSNRNRLWMSTTVCVAPTRCTSSSASRSPSSGGVRPACSKSSVSQKIDAVSASAIGQPALQRRPLGERHVVERVTELVRERRDGVLAAVEVHHDAADVALDAGAVRAALLAVAGLGVDPLLGERAVRQRARSGE